jgi:predicted RNA-binding Zn-ribbon protein involved in translation (DUF1610 family)
MCLSHQKNLSVNLEQLKKISERKYTCPSCGKETMYRVLGPCKTGDGITIDELERFHCLTCGSDFFDLPAMKKIRKSREKKEIYDLKKELLEYS